MLSDVAGEMAEVAGRRTSAYPQVTTARYSPGQMLFYLSMQEAPPLWPYGSYLGSSGPNSGCAGPGKAGTTAAELAKGSLIQSSNADLLSAQSQAYTARR